ncbi:3'-5' exonuclease [Glaciecola sp. KUL10]|uniref:3'-5' exonuclease n=1 Tax=Glaciecola sp. (strain KUL10) TaxID=2161813 RepID=UPI000D786CD7|nr:3'-5' exonuclease [Glaciecola sp. KUL10]GBL02954.1 endodeoxyribonuclease [Glaciecola sp. KUL10]
MTDVMIDIETLGSGNDACIVSIAAVVFNPNTSELSANFYNAIDPVDAQQYGTIDAGTVQWWLKQSNEARAELNNKKAIPLKDALVNLQDFLALYSDYRTRLIWGNGATFDPIILENAFKQTKITCPWKFFNVRDVRTIVDLGRRCFGIDPKKTIKAEGNAHNALDDARHQALYVSDVYQHMRFASLASEKQLITKQGNS